ncbi:hypothetical protein ACTWJ9_30175 [Streptomyces sp. GDS52]|uniref:Uncharacterized protein n=1 Tax=Streptomyces cathayae TaxID=3031124 RepID=A0ABY8KA96_9ACTN|nr:hypothetical protein [Streptomyces sp. HUAS 5]WGD44399.1 hypothetical protein PYS65_32050 [Streptomyces sp. HUAS 5]
METWWDVLPESVRERVDGLVLRDDRLRAIRVTMEAVQALEEAPAPRPGLYDCQRAVMARYQELAGRIDRAPALPRDVETLAARIRRLLGRLAALEAVWDGDTDGWFVVLIAVLDDPQHEVDLAWIRHGSDLRALNRQVPPWPEAQEAVETGTALAEHFNVPFHFASPHRPDDEAPRWRTTL